MTDRRVLTCPYCKNQKRLGYTPRLDNYHCWECGSTFKRSDGVSTYNEKGRLPKVDGRIMPVREDDE